MNITKIGTLAATALVGTALFAAPAAHAATVATASNNNSGVVIAQDQSTTVQATPSAPRAITVTTAPRTLVTISAKGATAQSKMTNQQGQATFAKLDAGKQYTVTTGDASTTVVPVIKVGKARGLTVTTTDQAGIVDLNWKHKATKARGGKSIGYTITATPMVATSEASGTAPITEEVNATSAELTGLDPTALYSFSVTPHNALGKGEPSVARMSRSLADITGITGQVAQDDAQDQGAPQPQQTPESAPEPTPAPKPAPKPGPGPAPQPSTRTIWVCPDGYSDTGSSCKQTSAYTYSTQQETQPYTYRSETRTESCAGPDCPGSRYVDFGTDWTGGSCPNGGTLHGGQCMGWTNSTRQVTVQVKNAAPSGWSDDGSQYVRTVQVKDAPPAGWSDDGSQYVRTASKIERVVPA